MTTQNINKWLRHSGNLAQFHTNAHTSQQSYSNPEEFAFHWSLGSRKQLLNKGDVAQWQSVRFACERPGVRSPASPFYSHLSVIVHPHILSNSILHIFILITGVKNFLPDRESNPGLPRDRRRSSPLDYRGLCYQSRSFKLWYEMKQKKKTKPQIILRAGFEPATFGCLILLNYSPPLYKLSDRRESPPFILDIFKFMTNPPVVVVAAVALQLKYTQSIKQLMGNNRGRSSDGRALAQHVRGRGIDTPRLQYFFLHRVFVVVTNSYHKKHNVSCRVRTGDLVRVKHT